MQNTKRLNHLYHRAGFGLSPQEWQQKKNWTTKEALRDLFDLPNDLPLLAIRKSNIENSDEMSKADKRKDQRKILARQNIAWLERMADPKESALLEKMTLFWHGHFACESKKPFLVAQQLDILRRHALGNFRNLVVALAHDPAMIRYLNNQQNKKSQPNENFARELLELFTIGQGNYTEKDIKEAARAFTGWSSDRTGTYVFKERQHDFGKKTFFGKTGNFNGEDIIDFVLEKRETSIFITRKIYRYFVNDQVNELRVQQLATDFYNSKYDIGKLMQTIFSSDWFYDTENMGTKIKSPVELMAGLMRQLTVTKSNPKTLVFLQKALGQVLYRPPNVAGWPGGQNWIDNSTLMLRLNLARSVFQVSNFNFAAKPTAEEENFRRMRKLELTLDLQPIFNMTDNLTDAEKMQKLTHFLLVAPLNVEENTIAEFLKAKDEVDYVKMLCLRLMSLPEYQMC